MDYTIWYIVFDLSQYMRDMVYHMFWSPIISFCVAFNSGRFSREYLRLRVIGPMRTNPVCPCMLSCIALFLEIIGGIFIILNAWYILCHHFIYPLLFPSMLLIFNLGHLSRECLCLRLRLRMTGPMGSNPPCPCTLSFCLMEIMGGIFIML